MKQNKITFNPKKHEYKYGNQKFISATTLIKNYFAEFDEKEVARKVNKIPKSPFYKIGIRKILKQWKDNREEGTQVHQQICDYFTKSIEPTHIKAQKICNYIKNSDIFKKENKEIMSEMIIYDTDYKVAGMVDFIMKIGNKVIIIDFKTNKKIYDNGYGKKAKHPVEHIEDCNLNHYTLQLSLYNYILRKSTFSDASFKLLILHIPDNSEVIRYEVPFLEKEIENILNDWRRRENEETK